MKIVHHPRLVFGSDMLARFHPFVHDRAPKALKIIRERLGETAQSAITEPSSELTLADLSCVHTESYLRDFSQGKTLSQTVELPLLSALPSKLVRSLFVEPALWNTAATLLAGQLALKEGCALSLGGGFHHAKASNGEGFCFLNDIAYLIHNLRSNGVLGSEAKVHYIDLDAHQGNGVSDYFSQDPNFVHLDLFNQDIYPVGGRDLSQILELPYPLPSETDDTPYLDTLKMALGRLCQDHSGASLIVYNAGNDVYEGDRLGGLALSAKGIAQRDKLVFEHARDLGIPIVVLASGGYSAASPNLLAESILLAWRVFQQPGSKL